MGFSKISDVSVGDNTQVLNKYKKEHNNRLVLNIPNDYLLFSFLGLKDLTKVLKNQDPLPRAILVDLDVFSLDQVSPVLSELKYKSTFSAIPIIGVTSRQKEFDPALLLKAGLDDCFYGDIDWEKIDKRVQFLDQYKLSITVLNAAQKPDSYKIPFEKRLFDIVASGIGLLLLSPLFLIVAVLIKLESKGPVFYTSKRIGTGYQEFDFIKFRSMRVDADEQLKKLAHLNSYGGKTNSKSVFFKMKNDPRVTRVGRVIRKTSIDELPQLINVFRGEMSVIGNRPLPLYEAEKMTKDDWARRFLAPAGLTGLWQVDERGKDNLSTEERVALDCSYAKGVSLFTDIKILLRTLPAMWQRN